MTNKKSTKRAFLMSLLSLLLCCSMLIGTTFAWFTDEVKSLNNKIVAGNLDVELEYFDGEKWQSVESTDSLFSGNLWEPGHTEVVYLKVSNLGTLALKYQLGINIVSETEGTNVDGETFKLSDYIYMGVVENVNGETGAFANRNAAVAAVNGAGIISEGYTKTGNMTADQDDLYLTVVVYMPESVGNEANYKTGTTAPEITLGINLLAIQLNHENDSFGPDYDEGLNPEAIYVSSAPELRDAMKTDGAYIVLISDITVTADDTTGHGQHMFLANGKDVTIDLNGKDITLSEDASQVGSLFSTANGGSITIKGDGDVEIKNGKAFVCWAMNETDQINIYGGNYFGNGDLGNNALIYVQAGKIDVYGGKFTYPVADNDNWGFNARDALGNKLVIEIHEGALLQHEQFQYGDNNRIQLAKGCKLEKVVIDGVEWYKVVPVPPVSTVQEANDLLNGEDDVILSGCTDLDGVITIPADYNGTLILNNTTINAVNAQGNANIIIEGDVNVIATSGSAITANGKLNLSGTGNLTAIAADAVHAYGIGGDNTTEINIEGIHIVKVAGGYVQQNFVNDTSYGKSEPEGGAAIGSGTNGAKITLTNVIIDEALGGSKAAGIGAKFWTGVTINITNCTIHKVVGGNASAGIGGSRVSQNATADENVTINIHNSTINAEGGQFAAGIGAGYDTHCAQYIATVPVTTINITGNSVITAKGGQYGAGIGTGYHTAGLAGKIEASVIVNATAGESREKYTVAMDVGFGVIDKSREAADSKQNSSFDYKGTIITVESTQDVNS